MLPRSWRRPASVRIIRMRLPLAAIVVALTVLVGATAAGATTTKKDQVTGNGVRAPSCFGCADVTFSLDTWSSPTGVNPTGTMSFDVQGLASFSGPPVCMNVNGNQAVLVGQMTKASGSDTAVGGYFLVEVWDNGKTQNGVSPDRMSLVDWGTSVSDAFGAYTIPEVCADPTPIIGTNQFSLLSGNIHVTDAG
jgi:hypothetical protein